MDNLVNHWWVVPVYVIIWVLIRLLKDDEAVRWFPFRIQPRYRVWLAMGLGLLGGIIDKAIGDNWFPAMFGGTTASFGAITTQAIILSLTGGRELWEPRSERVKASSRMFPPSGPFLFALMAVSGVMFAGCAAKPLVCPVLRIAADACETVIVVMADGTQESVPKSAIAGVAMRARQVRMESAMPVDAGSGR